MNNDERIQLLQKLHEVHEVAEFIVDCLSMANEETRHIPMQCQNIASFRKALNQWNRHKHSLFEAWKQAEKDTTIAINKLAEITDTTKGEDQ